MNPHVSAVDSILGILAGKVPDDLDRKSIREERIGITLLSPEELLDSV